MKGNYFKVAVEKVNSVGGSESKEERYRKDWKYNNRNGLRELE